MVTPRAVANRRFAAAHVGARSQLDCNGDEVKCCLCQQGHPANYSNCPARAQEVGVFEALEKRRCSRAEATAFVKERAFGYAGVASRQVTAMDSSLPSLVDAAVAKARPAAVDRLSGVFSEGFQSSNSSNVVAVFSVAPRVSGHACVYAAGTSKLTSSIIKHSSGPRSSYSELPSSPANRSFFGTATPYKHHG